MSEEQKIDAFLQKTEEELIQGAINMAEEINQTRGRPMTEGEWKDLLLTVVAKFGEANCKAAGISPKSIPMPSKADMDKMVDGFTNEFKRLNPTQNLFV